MSAARVRCIVMLSLVAGLGATATAQGDRDDLTRDEAIARMEPYRGPRADGVDTSTLRGKILCGYQGWFCAEGDGSGNGWVHYFHRPDPARAWSLDDCTFDLWPDVSELTAGEKFPTAFQHADGRRACVFSSHHPDTVARHFRWMRDYGIDGAFLQRFGASLQTPGMFHHCNVVMRNVQTGANRYGRTWALMYDLSGLRRGDVARVIMADWKLLVDRMGIREDRAYLHHGGRPVVAVWGIGFNDGREYSLQECAELIRFLKEDARYGGNSVMVGVPAGWLRLSGDALPDRALHDIATAADIISPWTVGRYRTVEEAQGYAASNVQPEAAWCRERGKEYLPVIFPGFSWRNLMRARGEDSPLDEIPRRKGAFLWAQACADKGAGAEMLYVAMFDEIDEATAVFKCESRPPGGQARFVADEGLPSDHYLWLVGEAGRMLRGKRHVRGDAPKRQRRRHP